jgi:2-succinyl-5-enolpyruvyl-6-hydroxy-3-cyclohexene-1-carboxylate synthase
MSLKAIAQLVALCSKKGIQHAILSPGSRCAPITLAFVRHPKIHARTVSDERSAAFIGLGMAQQLDKAVALVCTSGSAAYNYAPAIAEAFFQQIPLLVITADRPPEWIDQWDGQTIRQSGIYGNHIKGSFNFPDEFGHPDKLWHANRIANEAINLAHQFPAGPVHINIPLREPFYPEDGQVFDYESNVRNIDPLYSNPPIEVEVRQKIQARLEKFNRILILPGQQKPNPKIQELLKRISKNNQAIIVTDSISNLQDVNTVSFHDHFLGIEKFQEELQPDLIISFGKSIISKGLKLFLRKSKAEHWHIQAQGYFPDTFQNLSRSIQCTPEYFLNFALDHLQSDLNFVNKWKGLNEKISIALPKIISEADFGEYKALSTCLKQIPAYSKLHLANSMTVRYVNFLGKRHQEIICNRGTSGIDGSNSTAVGCTFTTKDPVTLVTGDMAFFYDRNAFWHNYPMNNLRIILLNNQAGGIFRLIDGPSRQPELEEFFETKQKLTASYLAQEFGFEYHLATEENSLEMGLKNFYNKSIHPKILEIRTESPKNAEILKWVKSEIQKLFDLL